LPKEVRRVTPSPDPFAIDPLRLVPQTAVEKFLQEHITALTDELAAKDRVLALAREMDGWYDETNHTHREFKEALFALLRALSPTEEPTQDERCRHGFEMDAGCPYCGRIGTPRTRHRASAGSERSARL
jgi:hypothetical protein